MKIEDGASAAGKGGSRATDGSQLVLGQRVLLILALLALGALVLLGTGALVEALA